MRLFWKQCRLVQVSVACRAEGELVPDDPRVSSPLQPALGKLRLRGEHGGKLSKTMGAGFIVQAWKEGPE